MLAGVLSLWRTKTYLLPTRLACRYRWRLIVIQTAGCGIDGRKVVLPFTTARRCCCCLIDFEFEFFITSSPIKSSPRPHIITFAVTTTGGGRGRKRGGGRGRYKTKKIMLASPRSPDDGFFENICQHIGRNKNERIREQSRRVLSGQFNWTPMAGGTIRSVENTIIVSHNRLRPVMTRACGTRSVTENERRQTHRVWKERVADLCLTGRNGPTKKTQIENKKNLNKYKYN